MAETAAGHQPSFADLIRPVADFPKPGVTFRDITPLCASAAALGDAVEAMVSICPADVDYVVAIEARGFIVGVPVALALGAGFVPVRKPAKLPREIVSVTYDLEYGTETLAMHADAFPAGSRVLIVDDVLATGGTAVAAAELVEQLGGVLVGVRVLVELDYLGGRDRLASSGLEDVAAAVTFGATP